MCSVPIPRWVPMMQSSELLSRTQLRYDVPVTRMELLRRWCSGPPSGSNTAAERTHTHGFSIVLIIDYLQVNYAQLLLCGCIHYKKQPYSTCNTGWFIIKDWFLISFCCFFCKIQVSFSNQTSNLLYWLYHDTCVSPHADQLRVVFLAHRCSWNPGSVTACPGSAPARRRSVAGRWTARSAVWPECPTPETRLLSECPHFCKHTHIYSFM